MLLQCDENVVVGVASLPVTDEEKQSLRLSQPQQLGMFRVFTGFSFL